MSLEDISAEIMALVTWNKLWTKNSFFSQNSLHMYFEIIWIVLSIHEKKYYIFNIKKIIQHEFSEKQEEYV